MMYHFEIHVTVRSTPEKFQEVCNKIGVKPIVVVLQDLKSDTELDMMTSSTVTDYDSCLTTAAAEAARVAYLLEQNEIPVLRVKIETVPWHPDAPTAFNKKKHTDQTYFESHIQFAISSQDEHDVLASLCKTYKLHLSRNKFKEAKDGTYIQMTTFRSADMPIEDFKNHCDQVVHAAETFGLKLHKQPMVEFAIFDSNVAHDNKWVGI